MNKGLAFTGIVFIIIFIVKVSGEIKRNQVKNTIQTEQVTNPDTIKVTKQSSVKEEPKKEVKAKPNKKKIVEEAESNIETILKFYHGAGVLVEGYDDKYITPGCLALLSDGRVHKVLSIDWCEEIGDYVYNTSFFPYVYNAELNVFVEDK